MRFVRVAAAATSLLVIGAASSLGSAGAATTGVGTSTVSTSVLRVALGTSGSLLDVRLLGDDAQSTLDSKTAAAPTAFSKLTALRATSTVLMDPTKTPAAPLDLTLSAVESRQPGGQAEVNQTSVDLANPGIPVVTGLGDIISGNLNLAKLTSAATATSAKSTLTGSLANASVAGALLNANSLASTLASTTTSTESTSTRAVDVDAITVLDLGALLDGLDIDLSHLTPAQVSALLEMLDVSIPNVDPQATLEDVIDEVQDQIDALQDAITNNTGLINGTAGTVVDALGLGDVIPQADIDAITGTAVEQTQALIDTLQAALAEIIASALTTLDATSLLKLEGVDVSVTTKAADTLAGSAATVTGKIGAVTIGNIGLPEIDLVSTAEQINAAVTQVNNTLSDTLATVSTPVTGGVIDLSDLVSIEVLKKTSSVAEVNGYNTATAGITGLTAKITPPVDLAALITAIKTQDAGGLSAGALIDGLNGTLPQLDETMGDLEATLGSGIQALQGGATVTLVEVAGVSEFRAIPTTTSAPDGPELAATGSSPTTTRLTALGLLLVAFGLGLGRWLNMPVPAWVRRRP